MNLRITDDMREANNVEAMADAFHPSQITGAQTHNSNVIDTIEAALLYGARRISRRDFLSAVELLGNWIEE